MKKRNWVWVVSIIAGVAALTAALTTFFIVREKKIKDEQELDEYLEGSIL